VLSINVHNHYSGLELTSSVYFSDGTTYCVPPSQQTGTGSTMKTRFGIDSRQKNFKCVSLYKLQRKYTTKADNQSDNSTASIANTATDMYLLAGWVAKNHDYNFCVCIIELTDDFTWDEDKLWALYREYEDQFHMDYKLYMDYNLDSTTWLMSDNTLMKTKPDVTYGLEYKLDIIIFEGTMVRNMKDSMKINPTRLVSSLSSMLILLIYIVSLAIRPSFKLNIHNQCLNVDLVSLAYITGVELDCHRPPDHKVCAGDTMRSGFIIKLSNQSYGVLIYKLQRKQLREFNKISEDTPSAIHLLAVWEISESEELCADVLLVRHDNEFSWEENNLKELYRKNNNRFRMFSRSVTETWSLYDNIALVTTFDIMNRDRILDITIYEVEKDNNTRMPSYIDLKG
jgi:hypothetical protein